MPAHFLENKIITQILFANRTTLARWWWFSTLKIWKFNNGETHCTKRVKDSPILRGYKNPMKKSNLNTAVAVTSPWMIFTWLQIRTRWKNRNSAKKLAPVFSENDFSSKFNILDILCCFEKRTASISFEQRNFYLFQRFL